MSEDKQPLSPIPEPDQPGEQLPAQEGQDRAQRRVTRGQQKRRQKSVLQYITVLFAAAFVLLFFTFMMERRQYELMQAENQEQIDNLQQSVSAVQSLQNLYDQNAALKDRVDELEEQLSALQALQEQSQSDALTAQTQLAAASRALDAMDWFWQIDEAYARGKYAQCRSLIRQLEEFNLADALPRESVTDNGRFSPYDRYQEIYSHLF